MWSVRNTTCLSLGLSPTINQNVVCSNCKDFFCIKLKGILENHAKTKRTTKFIWEESWKYEGVEHGKIDAREKIFRLLVPADSTTEKKDTITGKKDYDVALDLYVNPLVSETDTPPATLNPRLLESAFAKVAGASYANGNKPKITNEVQSNCLKTITESL